MNVMKMITGALNQLLYHYYTDKGPPKLQKIIEIDVRQRAFRMERTRGKRFQWAPQIWWALRPMDYMADW